MKKLILWAVLLGFSVLTAIAVASHGVIGIFQYQLANAAGLQVLVDLIIASAFFLVWMWHDTQKRGVSPWPWLILTLVAGSFGPLIYFIVREYKAQNN
ncbi:DUF2834 domain-containing protein [Hydromonas duriensis]|uniref:Uncharacterized protein DUF2834 n=1 Tax=Hydromonas duriensis TaxID=1527608 RepID=A0A4V3DJY8_9BURK|nr:DUF2834 domain-containing protein [Hydromonas duriensis]TDR31975.1 uncharacterized protein DUF2834 [Hydromonas duriensis]